MVLYCHTGAFAVYVKQWKGSCSLNNGNGLHKYSCLYFILLFILLNSCIYVMYKHEIQMYLLSYLSMNYISGKNSQCLHDFRFSNHYYWVCETELSCCWIERVAAFISIWWPTDLCFDSDTHSYIVELDLNIRHMWDN